MAHEGSEGGGPTGSLEGRSVREVKYLPILFGDMKAMYRNLALFPEAVERCSDVFARKFNGFR